MDRWRDNVRTIRIQSACSEEVFVAEEKIATFAVSPSGTEGHLTLVCEYESDERIVVVVGKQLEALRSWFLKGCENLVPRDARVRGQGI